jgi:hypothetical protein
MIMIHVSSSSLMVNYLTKPLERGGSICRGSILYLVENTFLGKSESWIFSNSESVQQSAIKLWHIQGRHMCDRCVGMYNSKATLI